MNAEQVAALLMSTSTEDRIGLYEAIWELNGKYPGETLGRKYNVAKDALLYLHQKGWIEFAKISASKDFRQIDSISGDDVLAMLCNPVSWYPEYDGRTVVFFSTDAGQKAYMAKSKI